MKNWKKVKLGELLTESRIVSVNPNPDKRLTVRLNTLGVVKRPFLKDKEGATKYFVRSKGQFIYGRQSLHKGGFGIIPEELDGYESSADLPAFDVDESSLPEWIYYFFKKGNFYLKLESIARGVGSKRIHPKEIFNLGILLPSKEEQKIILGRISELVQKHDEAQKEFEKQIEYVTQLRQSILEDAISGNLTKAWRKKNKILSTAKSQMTSIIPNYWTSISDFPINWGWNSLKNLVVSENKISYGVLSPGKDVPDGVPLIRVSDIRNSKTGILPNKRISEALDKKYKRTKIKGGEILITVVGSDIGMSAIAHENWIGSNIARAIAKISVDTINLDVEFVLFCIQNKSIQNFLKNSSKSIGQPTLNINTIENLVIPIPPLQEQKIITQKINELIIHCDNLLNEANENIVNAQKILDASLIELLGENVNTFINIGKIVEKKKVIKRTMKFDSNTTFMDLVEILQKHGKLHAEDLWRMSKFPDNIDAFYAELKHQIENENSIKEVENEKGYLELA